VVWKKCFPCLVTLIVTNTSEQWYFTLLRKGSSVECPFFVLLFPIVGLQIRDYSKMEDIGKNANYGNENHSVVKQRKLNNQVS